MIRGRAHGLYWTDRVAAPLDVLRREALAAVRALPVRAIVATRDRRVAWLLGVHACIALTLTVLAPLPLLVLLPLLLGVPHVTADLRYLVLRRTRRPLWLALVFLGCASIVAVNALALLGVGLNVTRAEVLLGVAAVEGAAIAGLLARQNASQRAPLSRIAAVFGFITTLGAVAVAFPRNCLVVLLHGHNVLALVIWLWLYRTRLRAVLPSLVLVASCAAVLGSGLLLPLTLTAGIWKAFGTSLFSVADWLAPSLPATWGVGLTLTWIFFQSVHFLVWLVLVPTDEGRGSGATSFRRSLREFVADLGVPGALLALGTWALVIGLGALAPLSMRNTYVTLASFHAWLELAVLAFYVVDGGPLWRAARPDASSAAALSFEPNSP